MCEVGRRMNYHRNTILYHVKKIKENTGLDPLNIDDLVKLRSGGWISVESELPKTNGTYNVTRYIDGHFISDSAYFDGQNTWHSDNRVNHSRPYLTDVIAWRHLPEPYHRNSFNWKNIMEAKYENEIQLVIDEPVTSSQIVRKITKGKLLIKGEL